MKRRIYGLLEAGILILMGAGMLWFALSGNYGLLMNPKFRPLTIFGAALVLVLGFAALGNRSPRTRTNTVIFVLMLAIVAVGKPYLPPAGLAPAADPGLEAGLWRQADLESFPRIELQDLCSGSGRKARREGLTLTTVGMVKRLEELDAHSSFALMTRFMYCCLADAVAVGVRVNCDDLAKVEDGQWLMISGTLAKEESEIELPNFRLGRAMISSVDREFYLAPDKIMSYRWQDQLPLLTEHMSGPPKELFSEALRSGGLWETLKGSESYTVLIPVDRAIENMDGELLSEMTPEVLSDFLKGHIVKGTHSIEDLANAGSIASLSGSTISIERVNGKARISGSRVLFKDLRARNGIVHYIYPALTPAAPEAATP